MDECHDEYFWWFLPIHFINLFYNLSHWHCWWSQFLNLAPPLSRPFAGFWLPSSSVNINAKNSPNLFLVVFSVLLFFEILVLWQAPHFWYVWKYILSSVLSVSSSKCFHGLCSEFMFFSVFLSGYNFGWIILHENLCLGLCIGSLKSGCKSWVHFAFA